MKFKYIKNHIIFQDGDKNVLLDTGSPVSVGLGVLRLESEPFPLQDPSSVGLDLSEVTENIGERVDILLGADILKNFILFIDFQKQEINFGKNMKRDDVGRAFDIELVMGIPVIQIEIAGQPVKAYVDTGAQFSYVASKYAEGTPVRVVPDFYPGLGKFDAPVYGVEFSLGGVSRLAEWAVLPKQLELALYFSGCQAIVGIDWFRKFIKGPFEINYPNKKISMDLSE